ncbi:hypothetical protein Mapa_009381 [Marchantia paleacea]|nr:hypothetical protein Mapa_009381 [Marchantia paleacea]
MVTQQNATPNSRGFIGIQFVHSFFVDTSRQNIPSVVPCLNFTCFILPDTKRRFLQSHNNIRTHEVSTPSLTVTFVLKERS